MIQSYQILYDLSSDNVPGKYLDINYNFTLMQETADILMSVINFLINDSDFQEFCQFSP